MDAFDFVIIGAGSAGEAAAAEARAHGASVAIVERELFGGSCPFWACMPSKTLLHDARLHALGGGRSWKAASDRRDWMISREGTDFPDDSSHVRALEAAGSVAIRGTARLGGRGVVRVALPDGGERTLLARHVILAVGSQPKLPDLPGLADADPWTNREATATRELPASVVILGGGATGVELAQVFAWYGVATTLIHPRPRVLDQEHPRTADAVAGGLRRAGVTLRLGVRASRVLAGGGDGGTHRVELSDGSHVDAARLVVAVGRSVPLDGLGLEAVGAARDERGRLVPDDRLRVAPDVYVIGDPAGPVLQTHVAHYQGTLAVRIALGEDLRFDGHAIPRAIFTDPETGSVGITLEEAEARGLNAFEEVQDLAKTARGYVSDAGGHVTVVVDRGTGRLLGAFLAGPGASEAVHEAVLAIRAGVPVPVLADTIHAFPTTARVLGAAFIAAAARLRRGD